MRIAPPSSSPRSRPKIVRIGVSAERSPCLTTTVRSGQPLGPCGADEVLPHRVQHPRPREPRVPRRVEERERDPRQQQVVRPQQRVLLERREAAAGRGDAQPVAEDRQRQQAGEEDRQRDARERDAHRRPVEHAAPPQRREHADAHPAHQPQHRGARRERQRDRQPVEQVGQHRVLVDERVPEAGRGAVHGGRAGAVVRADEQRREEAAVLHPDRVGQPELHRDRVDVLRAAALADVARREVVDRGAAEPRQHEEDHERGRRDDQQQEHRGDQPPNDVYGHVTRGARRAAALIRRGRAPGLHLLPGRAQREVVVLREAVGDEHVGQVLGPVEQALRPDARDV